MNYFKFLIFCLTGLLASTVNAQQNPEVKEKISAPFQYEGYSAAEYKSWRRLPHFVEMSDGVKLAVDVLIPDEGPLRKEFPVIFQHTPYNRGYLVPKMGPIKHLAATVIGLGWGPEYDLGDVYPYVKYLLSYGYIVVTADMRGTGASFGTQMPLYPKLAQDGKELIEWIAGQDWCDGNVGMMGPSYLGWAQLMAAGQQPEALRCIMPEVIIFDAFTEANCPGGIPAKRWLEGFSDVLESLSKSKYKLKKGYLPALPLIDEDGDGKLADERPIMDSTILAGLASPVYKDNSVREHHWYLRATQEHTKNITVKDLLKLNAHYFDSEAPEPYSEFTYMDSSPGYYIPEIAASNIPIYHSGGWFDIFSKGTSKLYATTSLYSNTTKLLMAPRFHLPFVIKSYRKFLDFDKKEKFMEMQAVEQLRFFDKYLKGIENGIDQEAPVYIYVMHKGWREEQEWPLKRQQLTPFYFSENGKINRAIQPRKEGSDQYEVDFRVSSNYGKDSLNRWMISEGTPGTLMLRTEWDKRCLTYETEALGEDVEVTGHPLVHLWVSSNQDDGDFYVYLSEVDKEGEAIYVTEGQLRAGWFQLRNDDDQVEGRVDVKPDLPWHGFKEDQYTEKPLEGDQIRKLTFDLLPTSYTFRKENKIRIAIAGADFDNFELNPATCPDQNPESCSRTIVSVHRSPGMASCVVLPLIPTQNQTASKGANEGMREAKSKE